MPSLTPLTVSVVIPAKDDARALDRCLSALARQTVTPTEVIVVDNDSSDDTAAVARRWNAIVVEQLEPGIPAAAAAGYDHAGSDVIARLDADTVAPPTWLANGLRRLEDETDLAAVTGPGFFYDGPRHGSRMIAAAYLGAYFGTVRLALATTPLFGSSFFLRRTAWLDARETVHVRGLNLHDDLDLTIHLTPRYRIAFDASTRVGISYRPFTEYGTLGLRLKRGIVTFAANWPRSSSVRRWRHAILSTRRRPLVPEPQRARTMSE